MTDLNWQEYNGIDACVTFGVWEDIEDQIKLGGYQEIYEQTMALYAPIMFMMTTGLLIDKDRLVVERERVAALQAAAQAELDEITGGLNALSPKQCIAYFYGTLGQTPYTGNTGRPTTDDKAMARLARKGIREAKLVQEIRGYNKLIGTYLDVETDSDGRIRTSYNLRGTREGRLSSSQNIFGTGMNLQNLHPGFKGFIIPNPGHIFAEVDKRQSEWVITAYACGDPHMINAIERGEDVHAATAHMITGLPIDLIKAESKLIGHETDQDRIFELRQTHMPDIYKLAKFLPRSMTCRQAGKKSNHGLNYIMGFRRFALENELPENEARTMVELYRTGYAGLPAYWKRVEARLARDRKLTNCFNRPRRFLGEFNEDLVKAAVAYISQSTNADLVNRGIIATYHDTAACIEPLQMSAQVHDSILNQYPIGNWLHFARAMLRQKQHLNPVMEYEGRKFQIESDLKIGLNWGQHSEDHNPRGMLDVKFVDNETELADRMEAGYNELAKAA